MVFTVKNYKTSTIYSFSSKGGILTLQAQMEFVHPFAHTTTCVCNNSAPLASCNAHSKYKYFIQTMQRTLREQNSPMQTLCKKKKRLTSSVTWPPLDLSISNRNKTAFMHIV